MVAFFINSYYTGKLIQYKSFEQLKDLVLMIFIALVSSLLVSFGDSHLLDHISSDVVRLIIGGFIGLVTFISLSYLFKVNSLFEIIKIIQEK